MWTRLAVAALMVVTVGCSSELSDATSQGGTRYLDLVVSDQWSAEQLDQVLAGVDFWAQTLDPREYTVLAVVAPCVAGEPGCIAPVPFEQLLPLDPDGAENGVVVGACVAGAVSIWQDMGLTDLAVLTAHELGHALGLGHEDPATAGRNLMAPFTGEMAFTLGPDAAHRLGVQPAP